MFQKYFIFLIFYSTSENVFFINQVSREIFTLIAALFFCGISHREGRSSFYLSTFQACLREARQLALTTCANEACMKTSIHIFGKTRVA